MKTGRSSAMISVVRRWPIDEEAEVEEEGASSEAQSAAIAVR